MKEIQGDLSCWCALKMMIPRMLLQLVIFIVELIFNQCQFFNQILTSRFSLVLSDRGFPLVSGTFQSILADLNRTMVFMVSILPLISIFTRLLSSKPLGTIQRSPTTIGIYVTFMTH